MPRHSPCTLYSLNFVRNANLFWRMVFLPFSIVVILPNFNHRLTCFCRFVSLLSRFAFFSPFCFIQFSRYIWWAQVGSNHRPLAYQASALACWAMSPFSVLPNWFSQPWWRWRDSNSWPPACRAGALPAELHPRSYFLAFSGFSTDPENRTTINNTHCLNSYSFFLQSFVRWTAFCFFGRLSRDIPVCDVSP